MSSESARVSCVEYVGGDGWDQRCPCTCVQTVALATVVVSRKPKFYLYLRYFCGESEISHFSANFDSFLLTKFTKFFVSSFELEKLFLENFAEKYSECFKWEAESLSKTTRAS
jgi:hypothetical protein